MQRLAVAAGHRLRHLPLVTQTLRWHLRRTRQAVAVHRPRRQPFIPCVAAVAHPGRIEQPPPHALVQAFAGDRFQYLLQPEERLARVVDARPRRHCGYQHFVRRVLAPVGQAGGVAQYIAGGDCVDPRAVTEVMGPQVVDQRPVKRQLASIDQLQCKPREHRLAQRGDFKQGRIVDRVRPPGMHHPESTGPERLAAFDHGNADPRHAQRAHLPWQVIQERVRRNPVFSYRVAQAGRRPGGQRGDGRQAQASSQHAPPGPRRGVLDIVGVSGHVPLNRLRPAHSSAAAPGIGGARSGCRCRATWPATPHPTGTRDQNAWSNPTSPCTPTW